MTVSILNGDCRDLLRSLPPGSVQCCVTSPPYFGLRDYGHDGQIGLEQTPDEYIAAMVEVFRCVRDVLADDGTLWLNIGDSYASTGGHTKLGDSSQRQGRTNVQAQNKVKGYASGGGVKIKDMIGIPWMLAFALRADGWYLRQDIIWHKPNPMPESVRDRCTKSHEYVFLMSKSERYYFDQKAISEPVAESTVERLCQPNLKNQSGSNRVPGKTNGAMKAVAPRFGGNKYGDNDAPEHRTKSGNAYDVADGRRNRRSVWPIATQPFSDAHFATFPPELPELCIKAGSRLGDMILDPFGGAGTTGLVADRLGRHATLIELNSEYAEMARRRIVKDAPLFAEVS